MTRKNGTDERMRALERKVRSTSDPTDAAALGQELRRVGRVANDVADLLDAMGPEAWLAWVTGQTYEWQPDTVDLGESCPDEVEDRGADDPRRWRRGWSVPGLAVAQTPDGPVIRRTHWTVDDAGEWDAAGDDEWPIDSAFARLDMATRHRDCLRVWVEYFQWVVEHGQDPLKELVLPGQKRSDVWRFTVREIKRSGKSVVMVTAIERDGRPVKSLMRLPRHVRDWLGFLDYDEHGGKLTILIDSPNLISISQANQERIVSSKRGVLVIDAELSSDRGPTSSAIMDAARRQLLQAELTLGAAENDVSDAERALRECRRCNMHIEGRQNGEWRDRGWRVLCTLRGGRRKGQRHEP